MFCFLSSKYHIHFRKHCKNTCMNLTSFCFHICLFSYSDIKNKKSVFYIVLIIFESLMCVSGVLAETFLLLGHYLVFFMHPFCHCHAYFLMLAVFWFVAWYDFWLQKCELTGCNFGRQNRKEYNIYILDLIFTNYIDFRRNKWRFQRQINVSMMGWLNDEDLVWRMRPSCWLRGLEAESPSSWCCCFLATHVCVVRMKKVRWWCNSNDRTATTAYTTLLVRIGFGSFPPLIRTTFKQPHHTDTL